MRAPQDVLAARLAGHSAAVAELEVQSSGRLVASLDAAGATMVWLAASLLPVASVPPVNPSTSSDSGTQTHALDDMSSRAPASGAIAWLPAPNATVSSSPNSAASAAAVGAFQADEMLLVADSSRLRLLRLPGDTAKPPLIPLAEAASASMPDGCTAVHQLAAVDSSRGSAVRATVYGRADTAAGGPVVLSWLLSSDDSSSGPTLSIHSAQTLRIADIGAQPATRDASPQRLEFAALLGHAVARLAITQARGQICLHSLTDAAKDGGSQHRTAEQQTELLATASLDAVSPNIAGLSSMPASQRTSDGTAGQGSVSAVALSTSGRHLAAAGPTGAAFVYICPSSFHPAAS